LTTISTPNFEGLGDLNLGWLSPDLIKTNSQAVACYGMSLSFEADVIKHGQPDPENPVGGLDRSLRYLPLACATNVVPSQKIPSLKDIKNFQPNPTSYEEVKAAFRAVNQNLLPALTSYLRLVKKKSRFNEWEKSMKQALKKGLT
jgi:hypothetical protein